MTASINPLTIYFISAFLLLAGAFIVFRIKVRHDYRRYDRLTPLSSALELLVCLCYVAFPSIYNPACWWYFWSCPVSTSTLLRIVGLFLVLSGIVIALAAMTGLGWRRTFGGDQTLIRGTGLYRLSRNPQVVGGFVMVAGISLLWPSWYALGWALLYALIFHMMVITEEEHLSRIGGESYQRYCQHVPRYLGLCCLRRDGAAHQQ
jgi:protein-S-isoprenylcysteine O-methyltransferase Ste14